MINIINSEKIPANSIDKLKFLIQTSNDNFIRFDISSYNLIYAAKTVMILSTYCFCNFASKKIEWILKDKEIYKILLSMKLNNTQLTVKTRHYEQGNSANEKCYSRN